MSGKKPPPINEEEIRDMEAQAAWRDAQKKVEQRIGVDAPEPEPTHSVDVTTLPDAPPDASAPPPPPPEPSKPGLGSRIAEANRDVHKAVRGGIATGLRGADAVAGGGGMFGAAADALDPPPNTEDSDNPGLAAARGVMGEEVRDRSKDVGPGDVAPSEEGLPSGGGEGGGGPGGGGMGGGGGGSAGTPGGMSPYTQKRDVKYGKQVAPGVRDAYGVAGGLDMDAARIGRDADANLFARERDAALAKVAAGQTAAAEQARIATESERITSDKLARIELLNREAQGKPDDLWSSTHILGRMAGFLALTLGTVTVATGGSPAAGIALAMGGKFVNGLINEDIDNIKENRNQAAHAAGREINLLHLHEENLKSKSKAVEATKLAYYDNVLQQMEAYKADHRGEINEANYENLQSQILQQRAKTANGLGIQEQADVTDEMVNKYRPPTSGGAGGGAQPGFLVRTPDGTWHSMPNEKMQNEAYSTITEKQSLVRLNNEIADIREKVKKLPAGEYTKRQVYIALLEEKEQTKLKRIESAEKQGVLREGEYDRARALTGYATHGLTAPERLASGIPLVGKIGDARMAAGDAVIAAQTKRWNEDMNRLPEGSSATIAERGFARNPATGRMEPQANYTGQDERPTPGVAPYGSESRSGKPIATADRPTSETTPYAPVRPYQLPAPAAHHGKKKKQ